MNAHHSRPASPGNRFSRSGSRKSAVRTSSAQASHERYLALARAKALAGDLIEAERYYQYAEHYHRLMKDAAA